MRKTSFIIKRVDVTNDRMTVVPSRAVSGVWGVTGLKDSKYKTSGQSFQNLFPFSAIHSFLPYIPLPRKRFPPVSGIAKKTLHMCDRVSERERASE